MDLTAVCWNYHLFGIPVDKTARLGVVCCEAGQKVERTVDIQLAGYIPWSCKQMGQEGVCKPLNFPVKLIFCVYICVLSIDCMN